MLIAADTFIDMDGNALTYTANLLNNTQLPAWLGFNSLLRQFYSVTPPVQQDAGVIGIQVTADDNHGGSVSTNFDMSIIPSLRADNLNPTYSYIENSPTENIPMNFTQPMVVYTTRPSVSVTMRLFDITAGQLTTGISGNTSSYFNNTLGQWLTVGLLTDVNNLLSQVQFIPTPYYDNNFPIVVSVQDNYNYDLSGMISMQGVHVNHPPQVANPISNQTTTVNVPFVIQVAGTFSDPDGNPLTYTAIALNQTIWPDWIEFNNLTFNGQAINPGVFRFGVIAKDPLNATAESDFSLTILPTPTSGINTGLILGITVPVGSLVVAAGIAAGIGFWKYRDNKSLLAIFTRSFCDEAVININNLTINNKLVIKSLFDGIKQNLNRQRIQNLNWENLGQLAARGMGANPVIDLNGLNLDPARLNIIVNGVCQAYLNNNANHGINGEGRPLLQHP